MIAARPMPDHIIGIDPGTACGWAVLDASGARVLSGTWDLKGGRHEGGGMRYLRARRFMAELLDGFPSTAVFYEEVRRHQGVDAAHVYGGIVGQVTALCEERRVPFAAIPVGTVKKTATGKGNASKGAMQDAAMARWGTPCRAARTMDWHDARPLGEDEADALWIAETGRASVLGMGDGGTMAMMVKEGGRQGD